VGKWAAICRLLTGALLTGLSLGVSAGWGQPATPPADSEQPGSLVGDAYYRNGQYEQARAAYRQALDKGPATVPLLYNLAGAHFHSGEIGWSVLYYQQALLLAPRDRDLQANLETALAARRAPAVTAVPGWGEMAVAYVLARMTLNELTVLGTLFYLAGAMFGWVWLRRGELRRRLRWVCWVCVGLALVTGALAVGKERAYHDPKLLVVVEGSALRSGPAESFPPLREANPGERGRRVGGEGSWQEVTLENGSRGYLPMTSLRFIAPQRPPQGVAGVPLGK
jgi:tetratricopeptide (TPR) repeat protein